MTRPSNMYECPHCGVAPGVNCHKVLSRDEDGEPKEVGRELHLNHRDRIAKWRQIECVEA